jgi:hypothetical protein
MAQLIFILIVVAVIGLLFRSRDTAHGRAWKRLALVGFAALVIFAILAPATTSVIANWIGIGRGADLVFYLTSFALMTFAALVYLKFRRMDERISALTRQLALSEWKREQEQPATEGDVP